MLISGSAFIFENNVDTDQIYPGRYLEITDPEEIAKHCMEGVDPDFHKKIKKGDVIVAGRNFGCGSSREHAAITLKYAGIGAVVAESFSRIFYRNAINLGLCLLVCHGVSNEVDEGDEVDIDIQNGTLYNKTKEKHKDCEKVSDYFLEVIKHGGIKNLIRNHNGE